jgi:hypothetical protein
MEQAMLLDSKAEWVDTPRMAWGRTTTGLAARLDGQRTCNPFQLSMATATRLRSTRQSLYHVITIMVPGSQRTVTLDSEGIQTMAKLMRFL